MKIVPTKVVNYIIHEFFTFLIMINKSIIFIRRLELNFFLQARFFKVGDLLGGRKRGKMPTLRQYSHLIWDKKIMFDIRVDH